MRTDKIRAAAEANHALHVDSTGGRKRHAVPTIYPDGSVGLRLYATEIMRIHPDGTLQVWTGGYNTLSTFNALNSLLGASAAFYTRNFVPYYRDERMTEGMRIRIADGVVVEHGTVLTPERAS